jgi:hypothetical protein
MPHALTGSSIKGENLSGIPSGLPARRKDVEGLATRGGLVLLTGFDFYRDDGTKIGWREIFRTKGSDRGQAGEGSMA